MANWDRRARVSWVQFEVPSPGEAKPIRKRGPYRKRRDRGYSMFIMRLQGWTRQEIANEFDVDLKTVDRQLRRTSELLDFPLPKGKPGPRAKGPPDERDRER